MINFIDETGKQHSAIVECKKTKGVNGEKSLTGTIYTNDEILEGIGRGWRLQFEDENYCLTYVNPIDEGTRIVVEFDAVHEFFFDLSKSVVYQELNGSNTAKAYLDFIFNGSGYSYRLEVTIPAFEKENFGMKNRLTLFNDFVTSTGSEFSVNGKIVRILEKVGSNLSTIVKKGFNLNELKIEKDAGSFITYIKGFGAYNDSEDQSKGRLEVEYLSPLADIYGKLEGDPVIDERYTKSDSLLNRLKNEVESSYGISVDIDMEDLTKAGYEYDQPHEGDYIMAINKDLGFEQKVRIMSYTTSYDTEGNILDHEVSCGSDNIIKQSAKSESNFQKNVQAGLENAVNTANQAWISADGKNKVFTGTDEPVATNKGDIWYQVDGEKTIMKFWNGYEWQEFIDPKAVQQAADEAKQAGIEAKQAGEEAKQAGAAAQKSADEAKALGAEAKQAGEEAKQAGADAKQAADEAKALGTEAKQAGEEAKALGNQALEAGQNAVDKATTADSNANTALTNANSAVDKATQASQKADNSTTVANEAKTQATDAATNANTALTNARDAINQITQLNSDLEDTNGQVSTLTDNLNGFKQTVYTKTQTDTKIATVQSDVNGFKTSVSNTYATKSEIQGIKAGVRNYICEVAWTTSGGLGANGETVANAGRRISGYIEINANVDYFIQVFEVATLYNLQVAFYDSSQKFISLITLANASTKGKTPANAASMRISTPYREQYGGRYKFEFGTVGTDWTQAPEDTQFIYTNLQTQVDQTANAISNKADKTTVDQISGRVDTAEGNITTMAGQIKLKANQSTVDTITNRVSATEASLSLQDGKITTLTTKTDGLDTSLSSLTQDYNGFKGTVYSKTQTDAKITTVQATIDTFKTTVSSTYSTKAETDNKVTAVQANIDKLGTDIAYAWSPYGTDRFTRVFRENLAKGQAKINGIGVFNDKYFRKKGNVSGSGWSTSREFMPAYTTTGAWSAYCVKKESMKDFANGDSFYFSAYVWNNSDSDIVMGFYSTGVSGQGTSFTVPSKQWYKLEIVSKIENFDIIDGLRFESTVDVPNGIYVTEIVLKKDDKDKTVRLPSDTDYDNAIPRYIGRSIKDSNSPSDYKWDPNPERKPWTSYAKGVNGEGLSLMPYGEQLIPRSDTLDTVGAVIQGTISSETFNGHVVRETASNWNGVKYYPNNFTKPIQLGIPYIYSCWFKIKNSDFAGSINLRFYGDYTDKHGLIVKDKLMYSDGWIRLYVLFRYTKNGNDKTIRIEPYNIDGTGAILQFAEPKLELANTMNIPTPWTPAPSEDPLGAMPKYVGTAALPYTDPYKYEWRLSSEWNEVSTSTQFEQTNKAIILKADQATVNAISGRVSTNEGKITLLSDRMNFRITNSDGSVTQIDLANKIISLSGEQVNITGNTYIANGIIKTAAIADLAVSGAKIANLTVSEGKIADLAVSNAKIANLAVDEGKIANLAVTNAKIGNLAVNEGKIADLAVTNAKIASLAVDEGKIANLAVTNGKIGNLAVNEGKIADLAVTNAKIANLAVSTAKIADLAVTNAKIGSISADKINVGTLNAANVNIINLNASNITTGTISGDRINGGTITGTTIISQDESSRITISKGGITFGNTSGTIAGSISTSSTSDSLLIDWDIGKSQSITSRFRIKDSDNIYLSATDGGFYSSPFSVKFVTQSKGILNWFSKYSQDYTGIELASYYGGGTNYYKLRVDINGVHVNQGLTELAQISSNSISCSKDVFVHGNFYVGGSKNAIHKVGNDWIATPAYETAESYLGDIGSNQTNKNGEVTINIEYLFSQIVNTNMEYQVFVSSYGEGHVWVEQRYPNVFTVKSSKPNTPFAWEIKAKRKGYEHERLVKQVA